MNVNNILSARINPSDLTDDQICDLSYGIKNFSPSAYNGQTDDEIYFWNEIQPVLFARLKTIDSAIKTPATPDPKQCPKCGSFTYEFLSGSNGTCCPNCI